MTMGVVAFFIALAALAFAWRSHLGVSDLERRLLETTLAHDRMRRSCTEVENELASLELRIGTVQMSVADLQRHAGERRSRRGEPRSRPHADPRVYVEREPGKENDRVILSNRSPVPARNVYLDLEGPGGRSPFGTDGATGFPIRELQRGLPYITLASFGAWSRPPMKARLRWEDPDGQSNVREFDLTW